jgi:hypothetical protein
MSTRLMSFEFLSPSDSVPQSLILIKQDGQPQELACLQPTAAGFTM